ncbi:MAG: hypothetical protein AB1634_08100 [Thermodesulfobacteriota bacterium]
MEIQPDLSLAVLPGASPSLLRRFLEAVALTAPPAAVEVRAILDPSAAAAGGLLEICPDLHLVPPRGRQPVAALGHCLQHARGRYLSVWDPAVAIQPGCLRQVLDLLDERPEVGIAGPRLRSPDETPIPSGRSFHLLGPLLLGPTILGAWLPFLREPTPLILPLSHDHADQPVGWLLGAAVVLRRETFDEIGVPDPRLGLPLWSADLCQRAGLAGWQVVLAGRAEAVLLRPLTPAEAGQPRQPQWPAARLLLRAWRHRLGA